MAAAAAAEAAAATGELLEEAASLRASLASLRASLTPSESEAMVVGETSNVARASMTGSFVPPPPSDDEEEDGDDNPDPPMDAAEADVLDALMAEARDDHLAGVSTAVSVHTRDVSVDGSESVVGSRELGRINLPSAESFDRSLSNSPASTPTTSPLRQQRGSRFSTSYSGEDDVGSSYDATWQPIPSAAEAAQRDVLTQLAGLPLEDDDTDDLNEDDDDVTRTMVSSSVSSSVNASDFLLGTRGGGYDDGFVEDVAREGSDVVLGSVQPSPTKQKRVASDLDLPSPPVKTPGVRGGDVAARMVLDARKRHIEQVRAEEARAFGERRRAAGKEALMRFFASKKEAAAASPTKRPSPTNTGVRRPLKLKSPNSPMGPIVASPVCASMETREAPLPRVATLKPGRGQWSREEPAQVLDDEDDDFAVPTEVSAHGIDPRAMGTPPGTTRRVSPHKPSPAIPQLKIPRVATHDPDAHRRSVTAAAALFNAEESVGAAAAYIDQQRSRLDVSSMDESAGMPPRRSPAPLPKVAGFAPGQTRHAKVELGDGTGSADGGWGPGEPNDDSIVFGGVNALGEVNALDTPPDAFPTWFGVVANETGEGIENVEPTEAEETIVEKEWGVPGLATGAAGVHIPDHVLAAQLASPSAPSKKNASALHAKNKSPKKKGEAMWVDLGAWDDASRVGIPSGAWGVGSEQMKKMAPRVGTSEVKKRSAAAAAKARERKMGALTAAIGSNRQGAKPPSSLTSDPKLFRAASKLSNKKLVRNALCHVCLAGAANKANLDDALTALDAVAPDVATVFVILFRENTSPHKYRALYALVSGDGGVDDADARLVKIHGAGGPGSVGLDGVDSTMKYDSGTREFKPLATSGRLTPLTAAVTLVSRK
jgi:hypothetical protein